MSEHHESQAHGSLQSYLIGFALSVVLTLIPFTLVMNKTLDNTALVIFIIFTLGAIQMLVHLFYFMHVSLRVEKGWQVMALIFTILLIVIIMAGSVWIMVHLHDNMMPAHEQIERIRQLP